MIYQISGNTAHELFRNWDETMIWSCLQGVMGKIYADDEKNPNSAMAILGDFCFLAGKPSRKLATYKPAECKKDFMIITPKTPQWFPVIEEVYQSRAKKTIRYAMKKEPEVFNPDFLTELTKNISSDTVLQPMNRELFSYCKKHPWCLDFVSLYQNYDEYQHLGAIGVLALQNGEPVSGASSYSVYKSGLEIEIGTKEGYRKQGLAAACGAKLILEALKRNLYPSWDAANLASVSLAKKLGYHFDTEYTAYLIYGY